MQRYFGAQLAERAAQLRSRALKNVREHDSAAQKMLKAGVIAQVERLQGPGTGRCRAAGARKARDDADLCDHGARAHPQGAGPGAAGLAALREHPGTAAPG